MSGLTPSLTLEQLRPIHVPNPIGYWPLAWGWQLVLVLSVLMLMGVGYWTWQRYHQGLPKREALRLLTNYETTYQTTMNAQQASASLVELLKRVALVYFPREEVAELYGEPWVRFLQETSNNLNFLAIQDTIILCPYMLSKTDKGSSQDNHNMVEFFHLTRLWIKQRSKPCLF